MATLAETAYPEDIRRVAVKVAAALSDQDIDILCDILNGGHSASEFKDVLITAHTDLIAMYRHYNRRR